MHFILSKVQLSFRIHTYKVPTYAAVNAPLDHSLNDKQYDQQDV